MCHATYSVNERLAMASSRRNRGCLVDRGANGCIVGSDTSLVERTDKYIDLTGIADHTVRKLNITHNAAVVDTHLGKVIAHIYQGASMTDGQTILAPVQMEAHGCTVMDGNTDGKQPYIQTSDGYRIPMCKRQGLLYVDMRPVLDAEWEQLPHIHLTSDTPWDPSRFDHEVDPNWMEGEADPVEEHYRDQPFDRLGNLRGDVDHENEPTTRAEVEANFTAAVEDELVGSVIECEVDGEIFHRYLSSDDEECDWGDWKAPTRSKHPSYNVNGVRRSYNGKMGPRRSSRNQERIDYKETKTRKRANRQQRDAVIKKNESNQRKKTLTRTNSQRTSTTEPTVETVGSDSEDEGQQRTDYNNPAKSTDQNDPRAVEGGPYVGRPSKIDYEKYQKNFCGASPEVIEKTFENTTQMGRMGAVKGHKLWKRHKAPNPALNVPRRNEPVATDTIYGPGCPAVDNGSTAAQFFVGRKSGFCAVEGLGKSDRKYPAALMNHIRRYGAMDQIVSDNARAEISKRVQHILNELQIKDWTSEPHNKNQNFAERVWRDAKRMTETTLNFSDAPAYVWLLALEYVCFVKNHTADEKLGGRTPVEWLLGYTPDITALLCFIFWEPVYYAVNEGSFPETPDEALGRFVGIADCVGSSISFKILTEDMKIITRSVVRTATKPGVYQNLRANALAPTLAPKPVTAGLKINEEVRPVTVDTVDESEESDSEPVNEEQKGDPNKDPTVARNTFLRSAMEDAVKNGKDLPTIDIVDILGRTFITTPDHEGEQRRAIVEEAEFLQQRTADQAEPLIRFKCSVGERRFEEIMTYNRMLHWCDQHKLNGDFYAINGICGHRKNHKARGGWQVLIEWASGLKDWRDISDIYADDGPTLALYGEKHDLLNEPGWRRCKHIVKRKKVVGRLINQVRLKNFRNRPRYKYGHQVPRSHHEAVLIDEREGNRRWQDAEELELKQLFEYDTFKDLGLGAPVPEGYKKIPCHMVYDVKWDGRHKARFVAGGHRTDTPVESTYSAVVSLLGVRMITFLAELNGMELWNTDIGNAYLESYTSERVVFIAGAEFGERAGHTMVIQKAQYGLKSSGKCWHDRLHDVLLSMGFLPSKAEDDIWMRDAGDHYEYIAVYVDDLLIASKNPQAIIDQLQSKPHSFKLKGTGPVDFHLGCDYYRDEDGVLCVGPRKYIERMETAYKNHFGVTPSQRFQSPLEKGDHPELDDSPLLDADGVAKYQSLIGTLQWTISLGRFDIATAVMSMSSFRAAPREGHLERVKRICGYLSKFRSACIRIRTDEPDFSDLPVKEYDWARSVYGNARQRMAADAPVPKGKPVQTTTFKDANLYHDLATGRAVTGVLHFLNQTPVDWFSKKQETVETATYGSEFAAARTAIQQIAALRQALQYLGVPLRESSYLFGDNESVVKSGSIPHSTLSKRHHALAYHYTREAVASKMVAFHHISGDANVADILSKHWGHTQVYPMLRPLLFYRGNTLDLIELKEDFGAPGQA